jgi:hypothetical protein
VATLVFPDISLLSALFDWAAVARCMVVSVFGAAIWRTNSFMETSARFRFKSLDAVTRQDLGKTKKVF